MSKLFSYVVHHDYGYAPNPFGGYCTLVKCKYKHIIKNIVELAEVGDWIVGTGGADLNLSCGHGKLLYAMRVDEKLTIMEYYSDARFIGRKDCTLDCGDSGKFALISQHYYYFGRNAVEIPEPFLSYSIEKRGPRHKSRFSTDFIEAFVMWLETNYTPGVHGAPCGV